jgi:hypothetical protein
VCRLGNLILRGSLPRAPTLLDSVLVGLQKPDVRGDRPTATGEVWYCLTALCAMSSTCVRRSRGVQARRHPLRAAVADAVTVLLLRQMTCAALAHTCLSAAALTQAAMAGARPACPPFNGALCDGLAGTGERVCEDAAGKWLTASCALSPAIMRDVLQKCSANTHSWFRIARVPPS